MMESDEESGEETVHPETPPPDTEEDPHEDPPAVDDKETAAAGETKSDTSATKKGSDESVDSENDESSATMTGDDEPTAKEVHTPKLSCVVFKRPLPRAKVIHPRVVSLKVSEVYKVSRRPLMPADEGAEDPAAARDPTEALEKAKKQYLLEVLFNPPDL